MAQLSLQVVRAAMLEKLRSSCLTQKHANLLRLQPLTEAAAAKAGVNPPWAGFKIPYFDPSGKVLKDFYRYRFWPVSAPSTGWASLTATTQKVLRYVQPKDSELHVYMPPLLRDGATWKDVMQSPDCPLHITEGELKTACVMANTNHIMLGLGGVFSWMSKKHRQTLIPPLRAFKWRGRKVYLVFDSDRASNPLVQLALSRLALALLAEGAEVLDVNLPPPAAPDQTKQGVDDYIAAHGASAYDALIDAAKDVQASAELHRLNDEVAFIWGGAGAGNVVRYADGQLMTASQFTNSYYKDRMYVEFKITAKGEVGAPRPKYAAADWLEWPARAKVTSLTYAPGQEQITAAGEFNLWRATGVVPVRGSIAPWNDLLTRMFPPRGPHAVDPLHLLWLKRWFAYPLVHPGTKLFNCVLVWSHKGGTGKNLLAEAMVPVYGASNCATIKSRHLQSDFNGWAEGKQFIIGDEITLDDKRHTSGDLKSMLTNRTVRINRKGIESYEIPDCCNFYFTSNDPVAVVLDQGERRTFVHHVPEEPLGDAYGRAFARWLKPRAEGGEDGAAHLAHYLLHELELGDFSPTAEPPDTGAKLELIANSRSDIDTWAVALRQDPAAILGAHTSVAKYAPNAGANNGNSVGRATSEGFTKALADASGAPARGYYTVYTPTDLLKIYDPDDRKRVSIRALGIALDRAGFKKALHNNGRLGNVRTTFWLVGTDHQLTSTEAAKLYVSERPEPFVPPSARAHTGKEKIQ